MAEGLSEQKVYFTRSRKRSMDPSEPRTTMEQEEREQENFIDLTLDDSEPCSAVGVSVETNPLECAICLQNCVHPARLPCGHIFCFLCVKGAAHGNRKCAMCRSPIPHNYFNNPDLVETPKELTNDSQEGYEWFYEGRNGGWWQYEERMSNDIEENYKSGETKFETLICGSMYTIDLSSYSQYKTEAPWQMRRMLREKPSNITLRGIAGLK